MRIRSIISLGIWAFVDQLLSSGTNFVTGIVIARELGPGGYGSFALAFGAWVLVNGLGRALVTQPYMVTESGRSQVEWKVATRSAAGAQLLLGIITGAVLLGVGFLLGVTSPTGTALVAVGLFMGPLVIQDFWRFAAFSQRLPRKATANDGVWAIVQASLLATLIMTHTLTPASAIAAWGMGAITGAAYGAWQFRVLPAFGRTMRSWVQKVARLGAWFVLSSAAYQLGSYGVVVMVGANLGRAALGGLRSTMLLFAPAQLVAISGESVMLPTAARIVRDGRARGLRFVCLMYSLVLAACFAAAGGVLLLFGPEIYRTIFGNEFTQYANLILPVLAQTVAGALASGPSLGIRALAEGRKLAGIQIAAAAAKVILVVVMLPHGLIAAAWGIAIAELGRAGLSWMLFTSALLQIGSSHTVADGDTSPVLTESGLVE